MKVALVHDFLTVRGGAELATEIFHELYPEAPVHVLIYHPKGKPSIYKQMQIIQSPTLQNRFVRKHWKTFLFLYPTTIEQFDLREYDVVLSNSYAFAKGVITLPETCHICYCQTPMRALWNMYHDYLDQYKTNRFTRTLLPFIMTYLRIWDVVSANRVDYYVASCNNVARRIKKYYGRDSTVINLPVDTTRFKPVERTEDYYLTVSRLVLPYKRVDIVIKAFNQLKLPLKIVGTGSHYKYLKDMSNSNVEFLGELNGDDLVDVYAKCKAFIFPNEDDFGITPLEAQACGRPVIAYAAGGALETVLEGVTGIFFYKQTPEALIQVIKNLDISKFESKKIREHMMKFDVEVFKRKIKSFISEKWMEYREKSRRAPNIN